MSEKYIYFPVDEKTVFISINGKEFKTKKEAMRENISCYQNIIGAILDKTELPPKQKLKVFDTVFGNAQNVEKIKNALNLIEIDEFREDCNYD